MRARWPLLVSMLSIGVAYAAYPYVTLYRLGLAIRTADAATLESLVNWPAVREGIKEDVCDLAMDDPGQKSASELPPFGASFMRGIASRTIDQAVTPQALLAVTTASTVSANPMPASAMPASTLPPSQPPSRGADVHVDWAFFDSPTTFLVSLHAPGQTESVKLEMDLRQGEWRIQRVWLPAELLTPGSKT